MKFLIQKSAISFAFSTITCFLQVGDGAFIVTHGVLPRCYSVSNSQRCLGKNADRAHTERVLEDMMGDDWRVFRAKMVAQERADALEIKAAASNTGTSAPSLRQDEKQPLHHFVVGALSSLFGSGGPPPPMPSPSNQCSDDMSNTDRSKRMVYIGGSPVPVQDPFASDDELLLMMQPKVLLDKHRWAHPISHVEPGCVLVANEKLGGVFHQTLVLIIDHNDKTGSTGIVINRPLEGNLLKVASETSSHLDLSLKLAFNSAAVSYGGPVRQDEYSILHGYGEVDGAKKVCPGVFVGGSQELMKEVRANKFDPAQCLFIKGHAAWVPNQLSREINKGVWYVASVSDDFLLRYAGAPKHTTSFGYTDDLWAEILTCMGSEYAEIARKFSGLGDKRMRP